MVFWCVLCLGVSLFCQAEACAFCIHLNISSRPPKHALAWHKCSAPVRQSWSSAWWHLPYELWPGLVAREIGSDESDQSPIHPAPSAAWAVHHTTQAHNAQRHCSFHPDNLRCKPVQRPLSQQIVNDTSLFTHSCDKAVISWCEIENAKENS